MDKRITTHPRRHDRRVQALALVEDRIAFWATAIAGVTRLHCAGDSVFFPNEEAISKKLEQAHYERGQLRAKLQTHHSFSGSDV